MSKIVRSGGYATLTIYDIPAELIHEFSVYVLPKYHGGIAEAIIGLMRKAVEEQKQQEKKE